MVLTSEDGLIENVGAFGFFLAALTFFISYCLSKGQGMHFGKIHSKRQPLFLLLALFFFLAMGEEISWGQRIFGWDTPSAIEKMNSQGEINLHNLSLVNGQNPDGSLKTGVSAFFTSHRIFYGIIIFWALLIPLGYRYSLVIPKLMNRINFPVQPIWMGLLAFWVLIFGKILRLFIQDPSEDWRHYISEISEMNLALMTAVIGFYWLVQSIKTS